ncbi:DUF6234 family protein [Kitasatospora sp. NPDC004531]
MSRAQKLVIDVPAMLGLLCLNAVVGAWAFLYLGFSTMASDGEEAPDTVLVLFLCAALPTVIAALAGWRRYWVTAVVHVVLALAVLGLALAGYAYEHRQDGERRPAPLPSDYHPCYSGSDCSATGG